MELYHHGIEGQKWGRKNGPPYPLDPEDHSRAEFKANPALRKQAKMAVKEEKAKRRAEQRSARRTEIATKLLRKGDDKKIKEKAKSMTKEELDDAISRLTKEKQYIDLQKALNPEAKKRESVIRDMIKKSLSEVGTKALTQVFTTGWNNAVTNAGHSELKITDKNNVAKALKGAGKIVNEAQKKKEEEPKKEEPKSEKLKQEKSKPEEPKQEQPKYVPESYKLEPKVSADGTIKWVAPSSNKKKPKK